MKYNASITNGDDIKNAGPSSFGTGRHACAIEADTIREAVAELVERARKEGWFGDDWCALVDEIGKHGQRNRDIFAESATIELKDDGEIRYWHCEEVGTV